MVEIAKSHGHKAIALTDHGTLAGAIQFIKACRKHDIKPVVGSEMYCCRNRKKKNKKDQPEGKSGNRHLNLFAKSYKGYQNLCTLSQRSFLEGYYYNPRIDFELLSQFHEGIICSSACLSNVINWNLAADRYEHAKKAATLLKDIFKDDFYLEMMYHGIDLETKILPQIQKLGNELDIKILAVNDSHYSRKEDAKYQEIVECLSQKTCLKNPDRYKFPYDEFYLKSTPEMYKIFGHIPQVMKNTLEIVEKCDLSEFKFGGMMLPEFKIPPEFKDDFEFLYKLAWDGLKEKGKQNQQKYVDRLNLELSDTKLVWETKKLAFKTYFLIVWDICRHMKEDNIPFDVRGSGNGSLLLYCLGITNVDPLDPYGMGEKGPQLLWSRFLGFDNQKCILDSDFNI